MIEIQTDRPFTQHWGMYLACWVTGTHRKTRWLEAEPQGQTGTPNQEIWAHPAQPVSDIPDITLWADPQDKPSGVLTMNQWWFTVGPASQTLAQQWTTIGSSYTVCWRTSLCSLCIYLTINLNAFKVIINHFMRMFLISSVNDQHQ